MEMAGFWLFWIVLAVLVGVFASSRGRNGFGWALLSFFLSPLLGFIILLVIPNLVQQEKEEAYRMAQERQRTQERHEEHEKQLEALKALRSAQPAETTSVADEISKLAALLDKGLLTEEEFRAQKAALLRSA